MGWVDLGAPGDASWPLGFGLLALYVAEHWAFNHGMRRNLAAIAARLHEPDGASLVAALPPASYGLLVGALVRAVARYGVLFAALRRFGWHLTDGPHPTSVVLLVFALPVTAELVYAFVWAMATMRWQSGRTTVEGAGKPPPAGDWARRQVARWHRDGRRFDLAARVVLLVWSCCIYGAACQMIGADMATWSDRADPMPALPLGLFLAFATGLLAMLLHVPLHLDTWLERAAYATTPRRRWLLRGSAWLAMACGLGPAWLAFGRYCWGG